MDANSGVDLCRVTVVAPRTRMDLALPTDAPLADLLPTLLRHAGENPDDPAFLRGGWVLQRLGENGLDPSQRLSVLGVRDGDVLYLRHRETSIPEFAFDDVADAIAAATRGRRAAWQAADARTASLVVAGVFFLLGALVAMVSGPPWVVPATVMLVASVVLLAGGIVMSRAFGEGRVGAYLGASGVGYAAVGGLLLLGGDDGIGTFGAAHLLVGMAVALVVATIAGLTIVAGWDGFFGAAAAAVIGALAAVVVLASPADAASAGAVAVVVALGTVPVLPTLCARLARLPLPQLPTGAEDLRQQTDVLPGPTVLQQAITADRLVAALIGATTAVCFVGGIVLVRDAGWFGPSLAGVTGLALLLRARHFRGRTQRLWLLCGGVACIALVALRLTFDERSGLMLLAVGVPCVVVAATLGAWAVSMTERRLSPYWGRATDLLEVFVLLAVVPLTLGVLGVYSAILDRFG